jgi:hypothetical protein
MPYSTLVHLARQKSRHSGRGALVQFADSLGSRARLIAPEHLDLGSRHSPSLPSIRHRQTPSSTRSSTRPSTARVVSHALRIVRQTIAATTIERVSHPAPRARVGAAQHRAQGAPGPAGRRNTMPQARPPKRPSDAGDAPDDAASGPKLKLARLERGPEEFSNVVKSKLQSYTRTGQACDRCKVRAHRGQHPF